MRVATALAGGGSARRGGTREPSDHFVVCRHLPAATAVRWPAGPHALLAPSAGTLLGFLDERWIRWASGADFRTEAMAQVLLERASGCKPNRNEVTYAC